MNITAVGYGVAIAGDGIKNVAGNYAIRKLIISR
jgi:hypothetical protein